MAQRRQRPGRRKQAPGERDKRGQSSEGMAERGLLVGRFRRVSNLSETYRVLSGEDEAAACALQAQGKHRQAVYFFIQAMEKLVRHAIFSEVSPDTLATNGETYRDRTRTHNLDELLVILVEVYEEVIDDPRVSAQVGQQLSMYVLEGVRFGLLHNDVRYPRFLDRKKEYSLLHLNEKDGANAAAKLERLKSFVDGFSRLSGKDVRSGRS